MTNGLATVVQMTQSASKAFALILVLGIITPFADAAPKAPPDPAPAAGVFVGQVTPQLYLGIVADDGGVLAYLCDGQHIGAWFSNNGPRSNKVDLTSTDGQYRIIADLSSYLVQGRVIVAGRPHTFALHPARGEAGVYRTQGDDNGLPFLGGWILLNNGKQLGLLSLSSTTSTTTLSSSPYYTSSVISPTQNSVVVLDGTGDSIDLSGLVQTTLINDSLQTVRWVRALDDDGFLAIDANAALGAGYQIQNASGVPLGGLLLIRGGLRVKSLLTGITTTTTSGWHMPRILNGSGDNVLNPSDPIWTSLRLFTDANANGAIALAESVSLNTARIVSIDVPTSTQLSTSYTDSLGNVVQNGSYIQTDGFSNNKFRLAIGVALKRF